MSNTTKRKESKLKAAFIFQLKKITKIKPFFSSHDPEIGVRAGTFIASWLDDYNVLYVGMS